MIYLLFLCFGLQLSNGCVTDRPTDTCAKCDLLVKDVYTGQEVDFATQILNIKKMAKPNCLYRCPENYWMNVDGDLYKNAVCNMNTDALSVDGDALPQDYKFECKKCNDCSLERFNLGENLVCPLAQLCAMPFVNYKCEPKCPPGSMPTWQGRKEGFEPAFVCNSKNEWIGYATNLVTGMTCIYPNNTNFCTIAPSVESPCTAVKTLECPNCNATNLIYIPHRNGYRLTCQNGALVTDQTKAGLYTICNDQGVWEDGITKASCSMDDTAVKACLTQLTLPTQDKVVSTCALGICYFQCKSGGKFSVVLNGKPTTQSHVKCIDGKLRALDNQELDGSKITCP